MPIFISYSFHDKAVFSAVSIAFEAAKLERWDSSSMLAGESLADQLRSAIRRCELCVFVATRRSIESPCCLAELGAFWGADKKVLLFMADPDLTESALPPQFKGTLRVDDAHTLIDAIRGALAESAATHSKSTSLEHFKSCGDFGSEQRWSELLEQSQNHFAALGVTLSAWRRMHQFQRRVVNRAAAGCQVRFLLMHPDNPLLEGVLYKGRSIDSVKPLLDESIEFFQGLQTSRENIEFRLIKSGLPHFSVVRADNCLVLTQYLFAESWGSGPTWRCVDGAPLFDVAMNDFEELWRESVRA